MKIMDRYILKEFVFAFLYCLTAFILLYIIADLFNYIDEMVRNHVPAKTVLVYYAAFTPTILVQVCPMGVLLATIYTLSTLKKTNEITAMRVSGVSLWRIIMPILFMGAILSIVVFVINDRVVPELMPIASKIRDKDIKQKKKGAKSVIENIAVFAAGNRIIYARSFDTKRNELKEVIIHQNDKDQRLVMKISAQKGSWKNGRWLLEDGNSYNLNGTGHIIGNPKPFRRKWVDLEERPKDFIEKGRQPEFMNYRQLKTYIERFSLKRSSTTRKLLVDLYYKTSLPFLSFVVIFVAAPFAFMIQRGGLLVGLGVSILLGLIFYGVCAVTLALGKAGILPPFISAWLASLFFLCAGIYLIKKCR